MVFLCLYQRSINAKSDKKNKYAIALYTKDDCFSIVCDTEKEQCEWLGIMHELQTEEDDSEEPRPYFGKDCIFGSVFLTKILKATVLFCFLYSKDLAFDH